MKILCVATNLATALLTTTFLVGVYPGVGKAQSYNANCGGCVYYTNGSYSTGNPPPSEASRLALESNGKKDPQWHRFRIIYTKELVTIQRFQVKLSGSEWKLDWCDLGTGQSSDDATKYIASLLEREKFAGKIINLDAEGVPTP